MICYQKLNLWTPARRLPQTKSSGPFRGLANGTADFAGSQHGTSHITGQHTKALSAMLLARTFKNERQTSDNCKESIKKEKKGKLGMAAFCFENTQQMHI